MNVEWDTLVVVGKPKIESALIGLLDNILSS